MKSDLPKVLFPACERPIVEYVLDALDRVDVDRVLVVVGYREDLVRETLAHRTKVEFISQTEQLGTGHAVMICREKIADHEGPVLVLAGDSPMIQPSSLDQLLQLYDQEQPAAILGTLLKEDPTGLGRIVRDTAGNFVGIVEQKDASEEQLGIKEVNMSTYVFDCQKLLSALARLTNDNRQREYYITDCPGILRADGDDVRALPVLQPCEALSVNDRDELAIVEQELKKR
jgi:bifunctional UDP-N-acetylglucosamine pyrophosphorylase/glucosamine-1-phosphate N-acetyltransferase/UDP-N-acetylglucosamine pyrophosphorylase